MPRIDGYPAADTLTGAEVLPGMQGGTTKSISLDQLTAHMQALLQPAIAQMIANALPGAIASSSGLIDDAGGRLLAL